MRRFSLLVVPESGAFHPTDRALMDDPVVTREALLHTELLDDGTAVILYRLHGDSTAADDCLESEPTALSHDVFGVDGDRFHAHVHFESGGSATELLGLVEKHGLLVVPPLEFAESGLLVAIAGTQERVRRATSEVPRDIAVRLRDTEPYDPKRDDLVSRLTERQRDVLAAAVELGYYETPRRATHADIAEALGCSTGTVGEHLRKVEAAVLAELAP